MYQQLFPSPSLLPCSPNHVLFFLASMESELKLRGTQPQRLSPPMVQAAPIHNQKALEIRQMWKGLAGISNNWGAAL